MKDKYHIDKNNSGSPVDATSSNVPLKYSGNASPNKSEVEVEASTAPPSE